MNHRADSLKKNLVETSMKPLKKQNRLSFETHTHNLPRNLRGNRIAGALDLLFPWPWQTRLALGILIAPHGHIRSL
jgi:hypothetical protein